MEQKVISLSLSELIISDASSTTIISAEHGDTGDDDSSPDVQHAANGDPLYPSILMPATNVPPQDNPSDEEDDNG